MWIVLCLVLTFGLLASSWASSSQEVKVRGCSHVGVFYVQGHARHSLNFTEAQELCEDLGATLASAAQVQAAYVTGLEICRYGWISDGNTTIVRQKSNPLCRAGHTGVIIFKPTETQNDAFCYDDTDLSDKNCTRAVNLNSTVDPVPPKNPATTLPPVTDSVTEESQAEDAPEGPVFTTGLPDTVPDATTTSLSDSSRADGKVDAQTTPFAMLESTEPAEDTEGLSTGSSAEPESQTQLTTKEDEAQKGITTSRVPIMETPGSGMGEPHGEVMDHTEYTQNTSPYQVDTKETSETIAFEDGQVSPGVNGRMNHPPAEDKSNSDSSDWLIIVLVIVAVAVILLVCAAVATRKRWCGKRQTLMITSKNSSEGNGAAASVASSRAQEREQEMVTLMNKEKIQENGNTEEFTVITLEESPEKNQQA